MVGPGHYALIALVSLAALAGGILAGLKVPRRAAHWVLGPFVLAAAFYAVCRWQPAWEAAVFPWPGYAFFERMWIYPLGLFILGCGGGMLPVRWNRFAVWGGAAALLAWSLYAGSWMLRSPCPGSDRLPVRGEVYLQSTGYTCAPAASATLLAAWGIEKSENEMAQLCLCVPDKGTSQFDIYRGLALAARGSGLHARLIGVRRDDLPRLTRPFLIGVDEHAVVVLAVRGDRLLVANPFHPRPHWRETAKYLEGWDGTVTLLCRESPFEGQNAPHLGAWLANPDDRP